MEILNTYSVYNEGVSILAVIFFAIAVTCIIISLIEGFSYGNWKTSGISFVVAILCIILSYGSIQWWNSTEKVRHEVIVSDFNKIDLNKYKIVDQKGKIIVLEEIKSQNP